MTARLLLPAALSLGLLTACGGPSAPEAQPKAPQAKSKGKAKRGPRRGPKARGRQARPDHPLAATTATVDGPPQTVVFVVLDTVRAQNTSLCGHDRPTTPQLDALVKQFGAAHQCQTYAPATWTLPSHTSYFTGLPVSEHHMDRLAVPYPDDGEPLLQERFAERGYYTAAVVANPALEQTGLFRGFDHTAFAASMASYRGPAFGEALGPALEGAPSEDGLYLFVNLTDAHEPYPRIPEGVEWAAAQDPVHLDVRNPEEKEAYHRLLAGEMDPETRYSFTEHIRNGYDYGIKRADAHLATLFAALKEAGRLDKGLRLVITSDHGEFLGEHNLLSHPTYTYEEVTRVPFVFYDNTLSSQPLLPPPLSALITHQLVLDGTLPTPLPEAQSVSREMPDRPIKPGANMVAQWQAGQPKLQWTEGRGSMAIHLQNDPTETHPQPADGLPGLPILEEAVRDYRLHLHRYPNQVLDAETYQRLKALGYVK